jgi:hypothetical protein
MLILAALAPATAPYNFTANELWTISIAAYAAIISTFLFGWDVYKWLSSGAKIDLSASMDMKLLGGPYPDSRTYGTITAVNVGDRPTTIVNLGAMYFDSWFRAYVIKRKHKQAFIISTPSEARPIPYRFEVGDQWIGMAIQSDDIVRMAKDGYLFLILYVAGSGAGHRVRLKFQKGTAGKLVAEPDVAT